MSADLKKMESNLEELRRDRAGLDSLIEQSSKVLEQARRDELLASQGGSLIELAKTFNRVKREYGPALSIRTHSFEPFDGDDLDVFWGWLEQLGEKVSSRLGGTGDPVKRGVDGSLWGLLSECNWSMDSWETCCRLVRTYDALAGKLHKHCFCMSDVDKGDDSYGDWTDSLPLAGREVVEKILSGKLETFKQVGAAVKKSRPKLVDLIQEGENYVQMSLDDKLGEYFLTVVSQLEQLEE